MKHLINFKVNGISHSMEVTSNTTLLALLRDSLKLKGTKKACGTGDCGACTVLVDGKAVNSCIYLALNIDGKEVLTVEGLSKNGKLDFLQEAFIDEGAVQCGYCTPGMLMSAKALLDEHPNPTEEQIRIGLAGNVCRCTGYEQIIQAIKTAAKKRSEYEFQDKES
ncbi:MAG TPA: (2Fe-2S)-binding protein [Firmicutes bacterium]|jgi:carbon-monoxide dehydrogenase small subunit|nr:(2Fe-2S)-binding protein [Bacillota bacterium]